MNPWYFQRQINLCVTYACEWVVFHSGNQVKPPKHNKHTLPPNFRHPISAVSTMEDDTKSQTSSDNDSLNGALLDIALGSDIDGLTDRETEERDHADLSDEDDGINVTIREIVKPNLAEALTPRLNSVVVVPDSSALSGQKVRSTPTPSNSAENGAKRKKPNRSGSTKRAVKSKTVTNDGKNNTLASIFAKAEASYKNNFGPNQSRHVHVSSKRAHSPESRDAVLPPPKRQILAPPTTPHAPQVVGDTSTEPRASYRDVTRRSLEYIVCLHGRPPLSRDNVEEIKKTLAKMIEQAILSKTASPMFRYHSVRGDGLYVGCSDSTCEAWLFTNIQGIIPWVGCQSHIMIIPQAEQPKLIRTVVCVPTRKDNNYILEMFTELNKNLNVNKWIIKARRSLGSAKSSLFIRMDEESLERLKAQEFRANWVLGTVQVNIEKPTSKPSAVNSSSDASKATVTGSNQAGNSSFKSTSSEVLKAQPLKKGLTPKGGSASNGKSTNDKN